MGQRVHASGLLLELVKNYDHNCELTFSDRRNMKKKKNSRALKKLT
jgi:hypothetical protein